jgi:ATP-dependent Clp protease, protease subunit
MANKQTTEETLDLSETLGAEEKISLRLLGNHTHLLNGEIEPESIQNAIRWIIYENMDDEEKVLTLYINSEGGNICDAFALIDMMRSSKHPVRTIGIGNVMSSGFMIFAAGTKGERYIGKNASILCHQYSDEMQAKHHDLKAQIVEGERINERMVSLLVESTEMPRKTIKSKLLKETDVWLTSYQMIELGIADHIL